MPPASIAGPRIESPGVTKIEHDPRSEILDRFHDASEVERTHGQEHHVGPYLSDLREGEPMEFLEDLPASSIAVIAGPTYVERSRQPRERAVVGGPETLDRLWSQHRHRVAETVKGRRHVDRPLRTTTTSGREVPRDNDYGQTAVHERICVGSV